MFGTQIVLVFDGAALSLGFGFGMLELLCLNGISAF